MTEPSEGPPKAEVPKEKNELLDSCLNYYTHAMTKLRDGHNQMEHLAKVLKSEMKAGGFLAHVKPAQLGSLIPEKDDDTISEASIATFESEPYRLRFKFNTFKKDEEFEEFTKDVDFPEEPALRHRTIEVLEGLFKDRSGKFFDSEVTIKITKDAYQGLYFVLCGAIGGVHTFFRVDLNFLNKYCERMELFPSIVILDDVLVSRLPEFMLFKLHTVKIVQRNAYKIYRSPFIPIMTRPHEWEPMVDLGFEYVYLPSLMLKDIPTAACDASVSLYVFDQHGRRRQLFSMKKDASAPSITNYWRVHRCTRRIGNDGTEQDRYLLKRNKHLVRVDPLIHDSNVIYSRKPYIEEELPYFCKMEPGKKHDIKFVCVIDSEDLIENYVVSPLFETLGAYISLCRLFPWVSSVHAAMIHYTNGQAFNYDRTTISAFGILPVPFPEEMMEDSNQYWFTDFVRPSTSAYIHYELGNRKNLNLESSHYHFVEVAKKLLPPDDHFFPLPADPIDGSAEPSDGSAEPSDDSAGPSDPST